MRWRTLALVVVVSLGGGCGGSKQGGNSSTQPTTASHGTAISNADVDVVAKLDKYVKDWNQASGKWSKAYKSGNRSAYLAGADSELKRLHTDAVHLQIGPEQIADPRLRRGLRRLGNFYQRQFDAVISVHNTVVNGDIKAGQRALTRLQHIANDKAKYAIRLTRRYPQLGASL